MPRGTYSWLMMHNIVLAFYTGTVEEVLQKDGDFLVRKTDKDGKLFVIATIYT